MAATADAENADGVDKAKGASEREVQVTENRKRLFLASGKRGIILIAAKILLPPCTASPAFTAGGLARAALAWKKPETEAKKTGV